MAYSAFDPRIAIREFIGTEKDLDDDNENSYCIEVTDNKNEPQYIPMYLSEEVKSEDLPSMPFIEMEIARTTYEPHDIGAATRKMEIYIDCHIYVNDTDNIDRRLFAKKIKDELQNLIRTNQCSIPNTSFINIESDIYLPETDGRQNIYHYITTIYVLYYDLC